jgi:hypothetical protein
MVAFGQPARPAVRRRGFPLQLARRVPRTGRRQIGNFVLLPRAGDWNGTCHGRRQQNDPIAQQQEETMAKAGTKKVRSDKRRVRDLGGKAAAAVKGGQAPSVLMKACATGEHIKEATITVR